LKQELKRKGDLREQDLTREFPEELMCAWSYCGERTVLWIDGRTDPVDFATARDPVFVGRYRLVEVYEVSPQPIVTVRRKGVPVAATDLRRVPCPTCGRKARSDAEFCSKCGTSLMG